MKEPTLKQIIRSVLFDVKGDNEYPSDQIVQANASLLTNKIALKVLEVTKTLDTDSADMWIAKADVRRKLFVELEEK